MTDHRPPRDLRARPTTAAELIERRRAEAADGGRPVARATHPRVEPAAWTAFVFVRDDGALRVLTRDGSIGPIDGPQLTALLELDGIQERCTLFADTTALSATIAAAAALSDAGGVAEASLARRLRFRAALPASVHFPVLSAELAHRWWLPTGQDETLIATWSAAFGLTGLPPAERVSTLVTKAFSIPQRGRVKPVDGWVDELARRELSGLYAAKWGGQASACEAFRAAGEVTDTVASLEAVDVGLRTLNTLAGTIASTRVHQFVVRGLILSVERPGRIRERDQVVAFNSKGSMITLTVKGIGWSGESLTYQASKPKNNNLKADFLRKSGGDVVYLAPAPFLPFVKPTGSNRWTTAEPPVDNRPVEIPVDIALAGAPVGE